MKKQHTTLTKEKWQTFPRYKQVLMIGTEFERANNNLVNNQYEWYISALSRSVELMDLTAICNSSNYNFNKELLRLRGLVLQEITANDNFANMTEEKFLIWRKSLYALDSQALTLMYKTLYK